MRLIVFSLVILLTTKVIAEENLDCESALRIIPSSFSFDLKDEGREYRYTITHNKKYLKCTEISNGFEYKTLLAVTTTIDRLDTGESVTFHDFSFKFLNKQIYYAKTKINDYPIALRSYQFNEDTSHNWVMLSSGFIVRVNGELQL